MEPNPFCITITDYCFASEFSTSYARNNRSSGQKSLRCFPCCSEKGHVAGGFCGRCIASRMTLEAPISQSRFSGGGFVFVCEIHPSKQLGKLGSTLSLTRSRLMSELRDLGTENGGELFLGELQNFTTRLCNEKEVMDLSVMFNSKLHSYDYSWKSNRWVGSMETHVVEITLFYEKYMQPEILQYITSCRSTEFSIMSCHKRPVKPLRDRGSTNYYEELNGVTPRSKTSKGSHKNASNGRSSSSATSSTTASISSSTSASNIATTSSTSSKTHPNIGNTRIQSSESPRIPDVGKPATRKRKKNIVEVDSDMDTNDYNNHDYNALSDTYQNLASMYALYDSYNQSDSGPIFMPGSVAMQDSVGNYNATAQSQLSSSLGTLVKHSSYLYDVQYRAKLSLNNNSNTDDAMPSTNTATTTRETAGDMDENGQNVVMGLLSLKSESTASIELPKRIPVQLHYNPTVRNEVLYPNIYDDSDEEDNSNLSNTFHIGNLKENNHPGENCVIVLPMKIPQ